MLDMLYARFPGKHGEKFANVRSSSEKMVFKQPFNM